MKEDPGAREDRLISGKLRGKWGRSGAKTNVVAVGDTIFAWTHRHNWFDRSAGLVRVYSFSVSLKPERTRELILDVTFAMTDDIRPPSTTRMARALEGGVRAALQAGWDPESRGRAFRYAWTAGA